MVQYTLAQNPEVILPVPGKDSMKAREKAMDMLIEWMDEGKVSTPLEDGFGPQEFIEMKEPPRRTTEEEDTVIEAVQILSNLAKLKMKVQSSQAEAMKVRELIDLLFTDETISEEQIASLNEGFKVLKQFAQTNLRYRDARSQAEQARKVLDEALKSPDAKQ
ncbi:MAG: hypothetical protein MJA27_19870 [Pseudanabaenales cyanobacterium]|nr:hypothetical protein [Pseudanabaenales cyanobacterium]